jgi:hypothetical protein
MQIKPVSHDFFKMFALTRLQFYKPCVTRPRNQLVHQEEAIIPPEEHNNPQMVYYDFDY